MKRRVNGSTVAAKSPSGLHFVENYRTSRILRDNLVCSLSPDTVRDLDAISTPRMFTKGDILFVEGQEACGASVIRSGRVKLSASSADGKQLILRMAEEGQAIGLPGTITGKPYEVTAEALERTQVNFVRRGEFLQFLRKHSDAALRVATMLCHIYHATYQEVKYLSLSTSAPEKLARFVLDLAEVSTRDNGPIPTTLALTHEEIGEMIGSSRETVTRLFSTFKKKQWLELRGSTLIVKNRKALQELVQD